MEPNSTAVSLIVAALVLSIGIGVLARLFVARAADPRCTVNLTTTRREYSPGEHIRGSVEIRALQDLDIHSVTVSLLAIARPEAGAEDDPENGEHGIYRTANEVGSPQDLSKGGRQSFNFRLALPSTFPHSDDSAKKRTIDVDRFVCTLHASVHCAGIDVTAVERIKVSPGNH